MFKKISYLSIISYTILIKNFTDQILVKESKKIQRINTNLILKIKVVI